MDPPCCCAACSEPLLTAFRACLPAGQLLPGAALPAAKEASNGTCTWSAASGACLDSALGCLFGNSAAGNTSMLIAELWANWLIDNVEASKDICGRMPKVGTFQHLGEF